jgi:hypothetical protein
MCNRSRLSRKSLHWRASSDSDSSTNRSSRPGCRARAYLITRKRSESTKMMYNLMAHFRPAMEFHPHEDGETLHRSPNVLTDPASYPSRVGETKIVSGDWLPDRSRKSTRCKRPVSYSVYNDDGNSRRAHAGQHSEPGVRLADAERVLWASE